MYELIQAGARTYYIDSPAKIGLYRTSDSDVWLIDSGGDKDAARRVLKILTAQGWSLQGIVNTHSNADHIGGNAALSKRTGCRIVSTGIESAFIRYPLLEPSFLYGGYPMKELRHKFLMAQASLPTGCVEDDLPPGLSFLPLGGHFFDMCGVRTDDDVVFLADCVFNQATIEKYHIFFVYDVAAFLDTLDRVESMQASLFVPSHAQPVTDIAPLVKQNREKVQEIISFLLALATPPLPFEEILKHCFDHYHLHMDVSQYALVGSTIKSYLSYLCDAGQMELLVSENRLLYHSL